MGMKKDPHVMPFLDREQYTIFFSVIFGYSLGIRNLAHQKLATQDELNSGLWTSTKLEN